MNEVVVHIESMGALGRGVARSDGLVLFVEGGFPGERVRARICKRKRHFAEGVVQEVLEPSPKRVHPGCPVAGRCGGCTFLALDYSAQLLMKEESLKEALFRVPEAKERVEPVVAMEDPFFYRNKMEFTFGESEGELVIGLHQRGDYRSVLSAEGCLLQSSESQEILRRTLSFFREHECRAYHKVRRRGLLRHLAIREGKRTGDRMVHLFASEFHPSFPRLSEALADLCTTFVVSLNRRRADAAQTEKLFVLKGDGKIREKVNGFTFEIAPHTFFQTNTVQAEKLFAAIEAWACEESPATALDAYAGVGAVGLHLSRAAEQVFCWEVQEEAVEAGRKNAALNGVENIAFSHLSVEEGEVREKVDFLVVDPPRAGLHKRARRKVVALSPSSLVYCSCNPATLARDLEGLVGAGYSVERVVPFDLFPHTFHLETLVLLKR